MATNTTKDACDLLDADHRAVKKLFDAYDELGESHAKPALAKKSELAQQICNELTVHTTIEEEIFYPMLRVAIKDDALLNEAEVEHATCKALIAEIEGGNPTDPLFDSKVKVLSEYIEHHVKEEREEMFPKARASTKLDLVAIRDALQSRKEELKAGIESTA